MAFPRPLLLLLRVHRGRVVAEHNHLDALQPHDAVGFGPAPIVADAHAENPAERAPDGKTEIARLEIALFEMLEDALSIELGMAGQMHFTVLADDCSHTIDENRRVEMASLGRQFGIAEREGDAVFRSLVEERSRRGIRHFALEPGIDLTLIRHVPAREEGGQRQLGIDYERALLRSGAFEQTEHAAHYSFAVLGSLDGAHLSGANTDHTGHSYLIVNTRFIMRRFSAQDGSPGARAAIASTDRSRPQVRSVTR